MKATFYFLIFFIAVSVSSQTLQKIKFQKNSLVYFFPKYSTDSVIKNRSDLFYLLIPDSLKKDINIFVENGQLVSTKNDSLFKLNYMPGLKYEGQYILSEATAHNKNRTFKWASLINGASSLQKNKIRIELTDKKEDKVIIENVFFYRD